jgi:hypothetical protein
VQSKASRYSRFLHGLQGVVRDLIAEDYGMALIVAVVMLVALTVIGIAALTMTNVGLKMAAGEKAFNVSLYNADAGASVTVEVLEEAILLRGLPKGSFKNTNTRIVVNDGAFWDEPMVYDRAAMTSAGLSRTYVTWPYDYYDDKKKENPAGGYRNYGKSAHNHDEDYDGVETRDTYDLKFDVPMGNGVAAKGGVDVDYLQMEETLGSSTLAGMGYDGRARGVAGGGAKRVYGFAVRGDGPASTNSRVRAAVTYDHIL